MTDGSSGSPAAESWQAAASSTAGAAAAGRLGKEVTGRLSFGGAAHEHGVYPLDDANARLLDLCAPRDWPAPAERSGPPGGKGSEEEEEFVYDLIAIGAGAGGLVSSKQSARRGFKSALIEEHVAGGDCLVVGCVPSKALLASAKAARMVERKSQALGVSATGGVEVDFGKVMQRMRECRARIAPADSFAGAQRLGVDVFQGRGRFTSRHTVQVGGRTLRFRKAVVATGARARLPALPGLETVNYLTNASVFNLTELPERLLVLGGGPIGCELGQAFAALGSRVTVLLRSERVLPNEDAAAAALVADAMREDGAVIEPELDFERVEPGGNGNGGVRLLARRRGTGEEVAFEADALLVSVGRAPNVAGLGLEQAGVAFDAERGISVDEQLGTSNPDVLAVGDVVDSALRFTHVSGTQAQLAVENALFGGTVAAAAPSLVVPRVTYTDPEVAAVGLACQASAARAGVEVEVYKSSYEHNDRAICDEVASGFCQILVKKGSDEIVGATIAAHGAGELIAEVVLAMRCGVGLGFEDGIGSVIHSYPTMAEGVAGCGFGFKLQHWKIRDREDGVIKEARPFRRTSATAKARQPHAAVNVAVAASLAALLLGVALGKHLR